MGQQISFSGAGITYVQDPNDTVLFDIVNGVNVANWNIQPWLLAGFPAGTVINANTGALSGGQGGESN